MRKDEESENNLNAKIQKQKRAEEQQKCGLIIRGKDMPDKSVSIGRLGLCCWKL